MEEDKLSMSQIGLKKHYEEREKKDSPFIKGLAAHAILGRVEITDICIELQKTNPDDDTLYVEHKGEIKEVSKRLVKMCMVD